MLLRLDEADEVADALADDVDVPVAEPAGDDEDVADTFAVALGVTLKDSFTTLEYSAVLVMDELADVVDVADIVEGAAELSLPLGDAEAPICVPVDVLDAVEADEVVVVGTALAEALPLGDVELAPAVRAAALLIEAVAEARKVFVAVDVIDDEVVVVCVCVAVAVAVPACVWVLELETVDVPLRVTDPVDVAVDVLELVDVEELEDVMVGDDVIDGVAEVG